MCVCSKPGKSCPQALVHARPAYVQPRGDLEKERLAQICMYKGGKGLPVVLPVGETPTEAAAKKSLQQKNAAFLLQRRIKRGAKLSSLFKAYTEHKGIHLRSVRFCYNGNQLKDDDTPNLLEMEDGDIIDVYRTLIGD